MSEGAKQFSEYRVEYRAIYGDNHEWQPRVDTHSTMADAVKELATLNDIRSYEFRITKRMVSAWEVVE